MKIIISCLLAVIATAMAVYCYKRKRSANFDFRNVRLGMTMDEVRKAEKGAESQLTIDRNDLSEAVDLGIIPEQPELQSALEAYDFRNVICYNITVNKVACEVNYIFNESGKLNNIMAVTVPSPDCSEDFSRLKEYFIGRYGEPDMNLSKMAIWKNKAYVHLSTDENDGEEFAYIGITPVE